MRASARVRVCRLGCISDVSSTGNRWPNMVALVTCSRPFSLWQSGENERWRRGDGKVHREKKEREMERRRRREARQHRKRRMGREAEETEQKEGMGDGDKGEDGHRRKKERETEQRRQREVRRDSERGG